MQYFGTSLTDKGHYRFDISSNSMQEKGLSFSDLPFNPEGLTNNLPKGNTVFYQGGGYTVIGISGSCSDTRLGTKSIFWVKQIITKKDLMAIIANNIMASKIISQMPFIVEW